MKIYFVGSISGKEKYQDNYEKIVNILINNNHVVLDQTTNVSYEEVYSFSEKKKISQYKKIINWIEKSDLVILETSAQSMGLGHEISLALERNKLVLVLYSEGNSTHFMEGLKSDRFLIVNYSLESLEEEMLSAIDYLSGNMDQRYNIMLPPDMVTFLNKKSKQKEMPKSKIIRSLINKEMKKENDK